MSDAHPDPGHAVNLSRSGPPATVLPSDSDAVIDALNAALAASDRDAVAAIVAGHPRSSLAWAALGDLSTSPIERYAAYRVGYHRGLDALRAAGWRGTGLVMWSEPSNRGFLRCVDGLYAQAVTIGEDDEAERCAVFLRQLDPTWPPADSYTAPT